ncbi:efflux RND transporter periplasmic adaptor subunit [Mucilaginibacter pedocola]|uniref:Efflux transporter periplasmic adaptor subunit n=1 Tax=Mucilaginibacter pedocola TaxID=1792845 RepID=A0A1S9PFE4_9SPHI|nr:efflux RND transporter periplasmic adaptor subunit [Mucilaginibacter pedocola]OOQ59660.1 efflux transporter periplasmic adaptor subunit [Mucilaginibacter pedocola]
MNKPSIIKFLSVTALAVALQSCGSPENKEEKKAEAVQEAPPVEVIGLQKGTISTSFNVPGELVAFQQVDLYAKVNSFVTKLNADIGSEVHAGELLATLQAPEVNSQLSGAESRLQSQEALYQASKATYKRLLETSKTPGTVSPNELDLALAKQNSDFSQLQAARAAYKEVGANRDYLLIRAPFDGIITARNVSAGAYVGPSGKGSELPVFTLQEQKKLRLAVSVPENYTGALSDKSEVTFTVKAMPGQVFNAKVNRMSGALDAKLRAQRIEMDVFNANKKLLPGMVAEVHIPVSGNSGAFVVPNKAILNSTLGVYLITVADGKAKWVPATTGRSADGKTEVFAQLNEGDKVVNVASEEIRDGSEIKTAPAKN